MKNKSSQYDNYTNYLESNHWKSLRKKVISDAGGQCEFCGSKILLVGHHLIYRNPLESCTQEDIMCLCDSCHNTLHNGLRALSEKLPSDREVTKEKIRAFSFAYRPINKDGIFAKVVNSKPHKNIKPPKKRNLHQEVRSIIKQYRRNGSVYSNNVPSLIKNLQEALDKHGA